MGGGKVIKARYPGHLNVGKQDVGLGEWRVVAGGGVDGVVELQGILECAYTFKPFDAGDVFGNPFAGYRFVLDYSAGEVIHDCVMLTGFGARTDRCCRR